jgi:hypothetical protein
LFFTARLTSDNFKIEKTEIASVRWLSADELNPDDFAFSSMKTAIAIYKSISNTF